jgi:flagellar hook-length control protein FliK
MSDLDATRSRAPATIPIPIPNLAQAKLGSLAARSVGTSDHEGVLDAFAEVFAHMAASAPAVNESALSEPDHAVADTSDEDSGDRYPEDHLDATAEESSETHGLQPNSLVDEFQSGSSTDNESNQLAAAIDLDDPGFVAQESEGSNPLSDQSTISPGPHGHEIWKEQEQVPRDILKGRMKKSTDDGARLDTQTSADNTGSKRVRTGPSQSERHVAVSQEATSEAAGIGVGSDPAADTGDRHRRRSRRDRSEPQQPLGEVSGKQTTAKAAVQLPSEHSVNLPGESLSELAVEKPSAPPEVTKAAAAAITGAPPVGSAATPKPSAAQSSLGSRSGATGVTTSLESTAAPKAETKSDAKGATREGVSEAVNRAKLIQRVSRAFQHLGPDGGVVRLRLAPAELGTVRIEMRINGRKMEARVVAETEAASNALREHLPDLRSRLESFGMQIERIEIETDSGETDVDGRFPGRDDGDRHSDEQGPRSRPFRPRNRDSVSRSVSSAAPPVLADASITLPGIGVDLHL